MGRGDQSPQLPHMLMGQAYRYIPDAAAERGVPESDKYKNGTEHHSVPAT